MISLSPSAPKELALKKYCQFLIIIFSNNPRFYLFFQFGLARKTILMNFQELIIIDHRILQTKA
jgi:hypothetical protein